MFVLILNEPIKNCPPSEISQSINSEWRTGDRDGNNSFSKSKKNFVRLWFHEARNILIEKKMK